MNRLGICDSIEAQITIRKALYPFFHPIPYLC